MPNDERRSGSSGSVLVVDDDEDVVRIYARQLQAQGFLVQTAHDGDEAAQLLEQAVFDVVVSDVAMPRMTGLDLLRLVRGRDLELPVILVTANPSVDMATAAIEHGIYRYLSKPLKLTDLTRAVHDAVRLCRLGRLKREALELVARGGEGIGDRLGLEVRYDRALASLWMAFQPIVSWNLRRVIGFEALVRAEEETLPHPAAILDAAERLGRLHELGRVIRARVAAAAASAPPDTLLFVNLHVADLGDAELYQETEPLRSISRRVILEITERAAIDGVPDLRARASALRQVGFRLALDDLGAGYSGLNSFAVLEPDVVKLDMALVRDIHREPMKQRIVQATLALCRDASIMVVAEGVETLAERDQLAALGCDAMQGYLFARPGKGFPDAQI